MKPPDFDVFITAEEAWPAFERAVLSAEEEIICGFRIFDMTTRLRSAEAKEVGEDWFDLLAFVLRKGVKFTLIVSDFDPVMATELHETTWRTVRQGAALAELSGVSKDQVDVRAAMHAARAGWVPKLGFLPAVVLRKWRKLRGLDDARRTRQAVGLSSEGLPELHTVTHHQKLAVIDGETVYIGGLDLNERRFDTKDHSQAPKDTWSDVQIIIRGDVAADARTHLLTFEDVTAGKCAVPKLRHLKRTLSRPRRFQVPFLSPDTVLTEIEDAHLAAFRAARHVIYIETQFLRSSAITKGLVAAGQANSDLTVIIVLPALPEAVAFEEEISLDAKYGLSLQEQSVSALRDAFGDRLLLVSPVQPILAARESKATLAGSPIVYVHNKVLVTDDAYGLVGSANLNGRSLRWDTEVAVEVTDPAQVAHLRGKLFSHWWGDVLPERAMKPETMFDWWNNEVRQNAVRSPKNRNGLLVPYDPENQTHHSQPLPGVTEDVV
nr:phospholipase D-like domain-containing protein [Marivita hallyeonensis]